MGIVIFFFASESAGAKNRTRPLSIGISFSSSALQITRSFCQAWVYGGGPLVGVRRSIVIAEVRGAYRDVIPGHRIVGNYRYRPPKCLSGSCPVAVSAQRPSPPETLCCFASADCQFLVREVFSFESTFAFLTVIRSGAGFASLCIAVSSIPAF